MSFINHWWKTGKILVCTLANFQNVQLGQIKKALETNYRSTSKPKKNSPPKKNLIVFWYNCSIIGMKQQPTTSLINCVCTWGTTSIEMWEIATPWTTSVNHICSQVFFISVIDVTEQFTIRNGASQVFSSQANTGSLSTFFYTSHLQCSDFTGVWSLHLFMSFMSSAYSTNMFVH